MAMTTPPPRVVTLVLVDSAGDLLGALPPFTADTPAWLDIAPVVREVQTRQGLAVTVLRLLHGERDRPTGGAVSYLAEVPAYARLPPLQRWHGALCNHPLRPAHADAGGPAADLTWARAALAARGITVDGEPRQVRTWSLSSLWQWPTSAGLVWLKVVPAFFAHEGALIEALASHPVPRLLAREGGRLLLAHVDGSDHDRAPWPVAGAMIDHLVDLQAAWLGREAELRTLGVPDWRAAALGPALASFARRIAGTLAPEDREMLGLFVDDLPQRWAEVAACGMPDGLVHGDFHAPNVRVHGKAMTILDWADSGIGQPLLDLPAFLHRMDATDASLARRHWIDAWQRAMPQADVERAARLLAPVATLRLTMLSQSFIDATEPSEHAYHRRGIGAWLRHTIELLHEA